MEDRAEYLLAMFAITKLGAVIVPLLERSTRPEMVQWFSGAEVSMVVASRRKTPRRVSRPSSRNGHPGLPGPLAPWSDFR